MSLIDLSAGYIVVGFALAVAVYHQSRGHLSGSRRWATAAVTIPLWPLWGPIALSANRSEYRPRIPPQTDAARQIETSLREGVEAAAGSPMERLLPPSAADRILDEVSKMEQRCQELDGLLERPDFRLGLARGRVEKLEASGASARVLRTARLRLENVRRLHAIRERDRAALLDLAGLVDALRTQLVLSRYAGSSAEGVGGIVSEVWSRVEGLGEALDDPIVASLDRMEPEPSPFEPTGEQPKE